MKIALILVAVVLVMMDSVVGQVSLQIVKENPKYPGQCYLESTKEAHPVGSSWYVKGECLEYSCSKSGKEYAVHQSGCGKIQPPPNCKLVENNKLQHPGCCPQVVCP